MEKTELIKKIVEDTEFKKLYAEWDRLIAVGVFLRNLSTKAHQPELAERISQNEKETKDTFMALAEIADIKYRLNIDYFNELMDFADEFYQSS